MLGVCLFDDLLKNTGSFFICDFDTPFLCLQREFERKASVMGGGNFVVPAQTVTDFLESKLTGTNFQFQ